MPRLHYGKEFAVVSGSPIVELIPAVSLAGRVVRGAIPAYIGTRIRRLLDSRVPRGICKETRNRQLSSDTITNAFYPSGRVVAQSHSFLQPTVVNRRHFSNSKRKRVREIRNVGCQSRLTIRSHGTLRTFVSCPQTGAGSQGGPMMASPDAQAEARRIKASILATVMSHCSIPGGWGFRRRAAPRTEGLRQHPISAPTLPGKIFLAYCLFRSYLPIFAVAACTWRERKKTPFSKMESPMRQQEYRVTQGRCILFV